MNHKSLRRIIIIAILIVGAVNAGCAPAVHYPRIIALGFVNGGFEISVLDLNNGTRQYVTNSKVIAPTSYSYCEVKKQVAFSAFVEDGEEIISQDLVTTHTKALTQGNNHFRLPVWSPDCSMLVFTSYDSSSNVLILNLENSKTYPIALQEEISLEGASWSPSSHFLATYIPVPSQGKGSFDLGIVDVTVNKLTKIQGLIDYPFSQVVWNADGSKIYFSAIRDTTSIDIYSFDLNHGTEISVIQTKFDDHYPVLSPDEKYLSFLQSSSPQDTYILGLFDLSTENIELITTTPMTISATLWLDDQRLLLSEYSQNKTIYYVLDIKTKALKEVSRFDGQFIAPKIVQP